MFIYLSFHMCIAQFSSSPRHHLRKHSLRLASRGEGKKKKGFRIIMIKEDYKIFKWRHNINVSQLALFFPFHQQVVKVGEFCRQETFFMLSRVFFLLSFAKILWRSRRAFVFILDYAKLWQNFDNSISQVSSHLQFSATAWENQVSRRSFCF